MAQTPQSATLAHKRDRVEFNGRIFEQDNIGITSKSRLVDATLTAYKLLDSAFINQKGNPNNLEERFKIQDTDKMIKEILGQSKRSTSPNQFSGGKFSRTSRATPVKSLRGQRSQLYHTVIGNSNTICVDPVPILQQKQREQLQTPQSTISYVN